MIKVFIGYDDVEAISYSVLQQSIFKKTKQPVVFTPVYTGNMKRMYWRSRDAKQSNEFSFTRFLVPRMCGYQGHAIWMDCDMLCRSDISELWDMRDGKHAVKVVKHDYIPKHDKKYLGNTQLKYEKKNWSSVMLFNCEHPDTQTLTPEYVNNATGLELHQFKWTTEASVGDLPKDWNWLVGEYDYNPDARLVHFTVGGPYFNEYKNCDYADEWFLEYKNTVKVAQLDSQ